MSSQVSFMTRANGPNNSQHCWMLIHVASVCTPCCMLLCVVGSCCAKFETGQTFEPTTPNISFVPWSPKRGATMLGLFAQLFQHCWDHARALHMVSKVSWVVSFPRCTVGPNFVGSFYIRLHIALRWCQVKRDDSQQHSVATLLRHCFEWLQHCSNIATLCCAKNRRCESFRVTSPLIDVGLLLSSTVVFVCIY